MKRTLCAGSLLVAAALSGCNAVPVADGRMHILPVERVRHAMPRADAMYQTGRYFQGQIRYDRAQQAYREALAENPDHVLALNGLAVIEASLGRFSDAEVHFQQAIALAPDAAYLYNNLGYAYLRADRPEEGQTALARARDLDPDNRHFAANFADATEALARHRQQLAAAESTSKNSQSPMTGMTDALAPPRLEIANGNGIRGMAARTAGLLREFGMPTRRLTNAQPYRQWRTEIQYLAGRESDALRVEQILPIDARLVEMTAMQRGIELRLIVGHDLSIGAIRQNNGS